MHSTRSGYADNSEDDLLFTVDPYGYDDDKVTRCVDASQVDSELFGLKYHEDANWFPKKLPFVPYAPTASRVSGPVGPRVEVPLCGVPPAPEFLLSTTCRVAGHDPQQIVTHIINHFADLELVRSEFSEALFEMEFMGLAEGSYTLHFTVRLYSEEGNLAFEMTRNCGSSLHFTNAFCGLSCQFEGSTDTSSTADSTWMPSASMDLLGDLSESDEGDDWAWIDENTIEMDLIVGLCRQSSPASLDVLRNKLFPKLADLIHEVCPADVAPLCALVDVLAKDDCLSYKDKIVTAMISLFERSREFAQLKCVKSLRALDACDCFRKLHSSAVSAQVQGHLF